MQVATPSSKPVGLPSHASVTVQLGPDVQQMHVEGFGPALPASGNFYDQVRQAAELVRSTTKGGAIGVYRNDAGDGFRLLQLGMALPGAAPADAPTHLPLKLDPPADAPGYVPIDVTRTEQSLIAIVTGERAAMFSDGAASAPFEALPSAPD